MSRRRAVRVAPCRPALLRGARGTLRCQLMDISAYGARLTRPEKLPGGRLELEFELGGESVVFEVELVRVPDDGTVAVVFPPRAQDRIARLVVVEERRAIAAGHPPVLDRRQPRVRGGVRGAVI